MILTLSIFIIMKILIHVVISEMNQWILFMFGTVIDHHRGFMDIKYTLGLCQNRILIPILSQLLCNFVRSRTQIAGIHSWYSDHLP